MTRLALALIVVLVAVTLHKRVLRGPSGWVDGAPVTDRTGLEGYYALEITYSSTRRSAALSDTVDPAAPPEFLTALQEQLGLKLQREKITIPVLVIDHIERPTPD